MQTTYVPPELSTNGRCGFVVGNLPTCANRRMRGGKYCKRHQSMLETQESEILEMARRAEKAQQWFPRRKLTQIYFIRQGKDGPVKIGKADNIKSRLSALQTASPYPLEVLAAVFAPAHLEEDLHTALRDHRMNGEWFQWCAEIEILVDLANQCAMPNIAKFVGWDWPYRGPPLPWEQRERIANP